MMFEALESIALIDDSASSKRIRKKVDVHCPVNVSIYDSNNNLVAYVKDGKVHCDDDAEITLVVRDDEC